MSKEAVRTPIQTQSRTARLSIYIGVPVLILLISILARNAYRHWYQPDQAWPVFQATVLKTRVVPVAPIDSPYQPGVLYRVEIDAAWSDGSSRHEAWDPAQRTGRDEAWLALWASQQGKHCIVRQSPRNPSAHLAFFSSDH